MATSVGLNMKFTASTGGLQQGVANAGKSLSQLSSIISQSAQTFDAFSAGNDAAAAAQQRLATDAAFLASAMKTGQVTAKQFEEEAAKLATEASNLASAFTEGASVTQKYMSEQEKLSAEMTRLKSLVDAGAISQETYNRAVLDVSGVTKSVADAEAQRAKVLSEGASVTQKYATEQEKQAAEIARLQSLLDAGAISQETYNRAVYEASGAAKEAADAESEKAKAQQRADAIIRKSMTSEEQYAEQLDELNSLMSKGYLDAGQYAKAQERLASEFNKVEKEVEQTDSAIAKMAGSLRTLVAIEIGKILVSGFSSVSSAVSNMIGTIRQSVGELTKLSAISNTSVEEFQGLATAAASVGIEQDKLADIFKDVGDRVGDFIQTGGGPMADFFEQIAPKVGVTADQFRNLSGPDALQLYVSSLEKAGLSQAEMTFYLEAMSSDLTALLPLLQNGGAGFDKLAERAERLGIVLSENQTSAITEMNNALKLVYQTFEGIIGQVVANLAPAVTAIAEEFLQFVEGYNGLGEGGGGNALADSITMALLDGAEYLAVVFDTAVEYLSGFGNVMQDVAAIFKSVADFFYRTFQFANAMFLGFRKTLNTWLAALTEALTEIISYIPGSGDIVQFGEAFSQNLRQSAAQDEAAFMQALENISTGLTFEDFGVDSQGPAGRLVDDLRARFEASRAARGESRGEVAGAPMVAPIEPIDTEPLSKSIDEIERLNEQYAEKSLEIERNRLDALGRVNQQALEAADIRSGGIGQVLALATGREDPAIAEARRQLDELQNISREIRKLGGTVELVGAA